MTPGLRIVAVEEHRSTREMRDAWSRLDPAWQDDSRKLFGEGAFDTQLDDLADARIRRMDASGVDVAVLSLTTPGVQSLDAVDAVPLARRNNDLVAQALRARPGRFEGFATLPTPSPIEAARELDRAVTVLGLKGAMLLGRTRDRNMDHPAFLPIYEAAAHLRVPLYIHPQIPQRAVRDVYHSGFGVEVDLFFATGGLGWHLEAGIQFLRLVPAGVFDRLPGLQVILGDWGEVLPFYLERIDVLSHAARHLRRPVPDYVRENAYVSPSGIFSQSYLSRAIEVMGANRILFSTDDPYVPVSDGGARRLLEEAVISPDDKAKIAHKNWAMVVAGVRRVDLAKPLEGTYDVIKLDVGNPGAIVRAVAGIVERHGSLDVLVNAAGSMPFKPMADLKPADWTDRLGIDLIGDFVLVREMLRRGRPRAVVNVASIHAVAVQPNASVYAAAKAALVSLTRSAAVEGRASRLRANVILPGAIDTPMLWSNPNVEAGAEHIAQDELGQPHDVAALTAFLASNEATFINGASITIDGARMAYL